MQKSVCVSVLITAWAALMAPTLAAGAGTVYYVSPKGNDANDGTSPSNPWKTLDKVDKTALQPGDTVVFQRGGAWRESLFANSSGKPDAPITYDAYGSGAKPIFYGSDVLANASFVGAGGNNYTYNIPNLPAGQIFVLLDNQFLGDGPAQYNSPTLTIASPTNPQTDGRLYTVCVRGNVIFSHFQSHLVFRNLVVDETAGEIASGGVQGYGVRIEGSIDVVVEDCDALHCGRHNFASINSDQITFRGCHAEFVAPQMAGGNTLYVTYCDVNAASKTSCTAVYEACTAGKGAFYTEHNAGGPVPHSTFTDKRSDSGPKRTYSGAAFDAGSGGGAGSPGGITAGVAASHLGGVLRRLDQGGPVKPVLDDLKRLAENDKDADRAQEAKAIIDHVNEWAKSELERAKTLETQAPADAKKAYQNLLLRFGGLEQGKSAQERLQDKQFQADLKSWAFVDRMQAAEKRLRDVPGAERTAKDAKFAQANSGNLAQIKTAAQALAKQGASGWIIAQANAILDRCGIEPKLTAP